MLLRGGGNKGDIHLRQGTREPTCSAEDSDSAALRVEAEASDATSLPDRGVCVEAEGAGRRGAAAATNGEEAQPCTAVPPPVTSRCTAA